MRARQWGGVIMVAVLFAVGCGSSTGPRRVWGLVSYDGKPVERGTIVFTPLEGTEGSPTGGMISDGRYDVPAVSGPRAGGRYRVEITALAGSKRFLRNRDKPGGPPLEVMNQFIPAAYNRHSTLEVTVSARASENKFDFLLQKMLRP